MNPRKLILVCLIALFIAAPAYAADIIVDGACSLHDAIIAANTDSPAGGCSAGSGADRILVDPNRELGWIFLNASLPSITSSITVVSGGVLYGQPGLRGLNGQHRHSFFDVASGGDLTLDKMNLRSARAGSGGFLVVRRGGRAYITGGSSMNVRYATCDTAIYNEGSLIISEALIFEFLDGYPERRELDPTNLNSRAIVNNGGTLSLNDAAIRFAHHDVACGTPGAPAAVNRPAPECKLEPQLQAGDRAIRRGGSYRNLRAEAGISGERVGRIESGAVVDVMEGPVEADGYNWYRVTADELEGWVAEAPARSFNCAYYFVGFSGELPLLPAAPEETPERQACEMAEPLVVGGYAIIAGSVNINYRAEAGLGGSRLGTLASGTVLEVVEGPEEADGYDWWQVRNVIQSIDGWLAEGGLVSSGECLRWLLPLETEEDMDESDEMMDKDAESEEAVEEDAEQSSE